MNLDAGELPTESEELWSLFDLLACACGGHAGDAASMRRVAEFCARSGVRLGAHPSYPDREGFGRRRIAIAPAELRQAIEGQCRALAGIAGATGLAVGAVKPHGALYHDAAAEPAIAEAVLDGATAALDHDKLVLGPGGPAVRDLVIVGPPRGALRDAATRRGLRYAREGFADRRMRADGSLVPRDEPDALITDPAAAAQQAAALHVDTVCVHADTPGALAIARAVREALRG